MESLSRPRHRKQTSSATLSRKLSGANGFSAKNAYDDVFSGPPKFGAPTFSSGVEDYNEIFGGSQASRASSIPVLDLSALDEINVSADFRSSKLDYSTVFGGFGDEFIGVSYEELFAGPKKGKNTSGKAWTPAETGSPLQGSDCFSCSEENQVSSEASNQSFDGVKQFNTSYHKTSQISKDGRNGTTHIAQLHAVPGFTCFIDEASPLQKTDDNKPKPSISAIHRSMDFSEGILDEKHNRKAVSRPVNKKTPECVLKSKSGSSWDGSYSNDKLFNADEIILKLHPSKVSPLSSLPVNLDNNKGHSKKSMASDFEAPKSDASVGAAGDYSPPFFDEELDVNSAAAVSAAALKRAIEKAQESIRIAKESMERKKEGLQSCSNWSFKDSMKVKNRRGNGVACEGNRIKEKNAKDTCERVDSVLQDFAGMDRKNALKSGKVAPDFKDGEELLTARIVVEEMHRKNLESADERGAATWFSELVNTGKHRTATLAFEQADSKNNIMQCRDKNGCEFKEMTTAKETLEQQEEIVEKLTAVEETYQWEDMERKVNAVKMAQEGEQNVDKLESARVSHEHGENEKLGIALEDEATEEKQKGFYEQEKCEMKKFQETINEKKFESQGLKENDYEKRLNEAQELMENEKEQQEDPEQEQIESRIEDVHEREENENRPRRDHDEEEIEKRLKTACQREENDNKLKEACGGDSNEEKQNGAHKGKDTENMLDEVHELKIGEKRPADAHDWEESENRPKEECEWVGNEKKLAGAYKYEETESIQSDTDQSQENEMMEVTQEAVYEENFDTADDECEHDAINSIGETQEVYSETNQEVIASEENGRILGVTKAFFEYESDEEAETVTLAYKLKEKEIFKKDGLFQDAAEDNEIESMMKDALEAHPSDDSAENFGSTDMNFGQREIEQNNKECELSSNLENGIEILVHESGGNEENVKEDEIAFDEVEEKNNFETAREERQWVDNGKKLEASQLLSVSKGKEKTMQIDEEIKTSQNTENNVENLNESFAMEEDAKETKQKEEEKEHLRKFEEANKRVKEHEKDRAVCLEENEHLRKQEASQLPSVSKGKEKTMEIDEGIKACQNTEKNVENLNETFAMEEDAKETKQKEHLQKIKAANKRIREQEKDRVAVERAIREARERAFAESRERAERAAVERATAEVRQRVMAETREKLEKASAGTKSSTEKTSIEAKLRAERAAVERATAEARERALEKALSQKTTSVARAQAEKFVADKFSGTSRDTGMRQSFSSSDLQSSDGMNNESAQRCKARLERHQRIMERAAKALAEKNMRDLLAQKEQAERNRLAEGLDGDIKRWSNGKEGNLRALLSTLQYILGPESGWQAISLTEIITTNAVKKAYRKATLYVHPDKLQQRGATIQQKYTCEKVFDLLKAAWNKFNSEER